MNTEKKITISFIVVTVLLLVGGVWFLNAQDSKEQVKLNKPLMGEEISVTRNHVSEGTEIEYNSNPPAGGNHYPVTAHAGIYDKAPKDGYLVHSLEHGAVILWYKEDLSKSDMEGLKNIFNQLGGKTIMTPRKGMDTKVALTSWGRILKLEKIDKKKILEFYNTNYDRGLEKAPI